MKKVLILVFLAAAAAAGWWFWSSRGNSQKVEYSTAPVSRGEMTQMVTATGTLNPVINVQVGSQISGIIYKLEADFNSPVKAGQVVAMIDPATYQAIVHQNEGELASAQAALEIAQITAKRKKELVAQNAAPQADLDAALATLHQAEAAVQIKIANLERAKVDLERCTITSPIDGTVISRSVDVGQTVAASFNAPVLFTIANDLTKMQINAAVAEADVGNVEEGQDVDFTVDAFPFRTFRGQVSQVRNAATTVQNVVTYDVVIAVSNPDLKLKPGMTANVSIIVAHRESTLKIPNSALRFRPPDQPAAAPSTARPSPGGRGPGRRSGGPSRERSIYTLKGGKPEQTTVKLGINDGISTEVLEGLQEGELVVTGMTGGTAARSAPPASNPFGGGRRRF